ncbi:sce7726 family protein [Bifidobacterium sp. ESL0790]|uniref:sce7726 family protein n=1 Tax=Bifidobacterium sp. ESL0790 TaxID=2983233 RepID=UPI0023F83DB5|nr:sce7726 family protein [Bifidobacterium sp. ESL0790]WEV72715.1 sce7726 family protein [Bifidobacterium sp. ESL0790]
MADAVRALNHVFSTHVLQDLLDSGFSKTFQTAADKSVSGFDSMTYGQIFTKIYRYLYRNQRNEFVYQDVLFRKLLKKHSPRTTVAFRQLPVGDSIADFVMINGCGRAYEIKSDLDTFDRLEQQLQHYLTVFSYVYVVVPEARFQEVLNLLDTFTGYGSFIGVYAVTRRNAISAKHVRRAQRCTDFLDSKSLFYMLRKPEYEKVLLEAFGKLPQVTPVQYFSTCMEWFSILPVLKQQEFVMRTLKQRKLANFQISGNVQDELQSLVYFSDWRYDEKRLNALLRSDYRRR